MDFQDERTWRQDFEYRRVKARFRTLSLLILAGFALTGCSPASDTETCNKIEDEAGIIALQLNSIEDTLVRMSISGNLDPSQLKIQSSEIRSALGRLQDVPASEELKAALGAYRDDLMRMLRHSDAGDFFGAGDISVELLSSTQTLVNLCEK